MKNIRATYSEDFTNKDGIKQQIVVALALMASYEEVCHVCQ